MIDISELRRLEAEATPGEWFDTDYGVVRQGRTDAPIASIYGDREVFPQDERMLANAALIVAMRNSLPELLKAVEWQSMDSAPKDTKILVGYRNSLGNWRTVTACYHTQLPWSEDAWRDDDDESEYAPEGWYEESETHENILPIEHYPIAWMPLPLPPHGGSDVG